MIAPPLLVSYSSLGEYLEALGSELRGLHETEIILLYEKRLPIVVSFRCLSVLFGFSTHFVNKLAQQNWKFYRTFTVRKGKKKRTIHAPKVALKVIQKWFGYYLSKELNFSENVYGFVPGKSAIDAANMHINARWVYSVDIEDFFPTTTNVIIKESLRTIGYTSEAADIITGICCYKDTLAQGAPSSPVLSNLVFKDLDRRLKEISDNNQIRFTRYADDIVFSGIDEFPTVIKDQISGLFKETCWKLSPGKEYFSERPKRLKVHGLLVHGEKARLTKGYRNRIRAYKYLLNTGKIRSEDFDRVIGHIRYAESVDR
ncbi:reverse transcriptase family protein [Nitrosomonas sp.]|uniref:reverse transcriptase family protein n=1 Tax=Nitrosomonas sp. TaxID=42353 RepID=UPI0027308BEE|nr:reverse transcriptase family protein [Nitrosomonas sp.]